MRQEKIIISSLWGEQCPAAEVLPRSQTPLGGFGCRDHRVPHIQLLQTSLRALTLQQRGGKSVGQETFFFSV